jgi:hypothetical protein
MAISNVTFSHITSVNAGQAGQFDCVPESPCRGITLDSVTHTGSLGSGWSCSHVYGTAVQPVSPSIGSCLQG